MDTRNSSTGGRVDVHESIMFEDVAARDLYTCAQQPYLALLREAENQRLLKCLPTQQKTDQVARSRQLIINRCNELVRWLALSLANGLIGAGMQIRTWAVGTSSRRAVKGLTRYFWNKKSQMLTIMDID